MTANRLAGSIIFRNNVQVHGVTDGRAMLFAHGFGCDQNMWRQALRARDVLVGRRCTITAKPLVRLTRRALDDEAARVASLRGASEAVLVLD